MDAEKYEGIYIFRKFSNDELNSDESDSYCYLICNHCFVSLLLGRVLFGLFSFILFILQIFLYNKNKLKMPCH